MKRLLIDYNGDAVRTVLMIDKKLKEVFIDHKDNGSLVGHIINGVVKNILPSQFAFIDIGKEKNAFMNIPKNHVMKLGQRITVQVRKDATGDKASNVSEVLHFKGRLVILYQSRTQEVGVSKKISPNGERKRLHNIASKLLPPGYSCILRTQSKGVNENVLHKEFNYLADLCDKTLEKSQHSPVYKVLYQENFILNDLLTDDLEEIIINDVEAFNLFKNIGRVKLWEEERRLFDAFDVERQLLKALQRNVWLPCGGFVTFDQTEACVVIDVNTGKFMGRKNYRDTILKANLEAAEVIAAQIALRNLSGMIIVDFIDMPCTSDKNKLLNVFDTELKKDRISANIVGMTSLGLVQLTRRKQREPLHMLLQQPCPCCKGTGWTLKRESR